MRRINGFSLMEMMVVLLITAVVAAASAPMINKKLMHNQAEGTSPWIYTSLDNSIAYNIKNNPDMTASIGAVRTGINDSNKKPRLFIKSNKRNPHITFDDGETKTAMRLADKSIIITDNDSMLTEETEQAPVNTIAIGHGVEVSDYNLALGNYTKTSKKGAIAIGANYEYLNATGNGSTFYRTRALGLDSIAIGTNAYANSENSIAIGYESNVENTGNKNSIAIGYCSRVYSGEDNIAIGKDVLSGNRSIAIGSSGLGDSNETKAIGGNSIAIGNGAQAKGENSVAIGNGAKAEHENSVAIGNGAVATAENQIILGKTGQSGVSANTVYIPGNLVVDGICVLGREKKPVYINVKWKNGMGLWGDHVCELYQNVAYEYVQKNRIEPKSTIPTNGNLEDHLGVELPEYPMMPLPDSDRRLKNVGKAFTGGLEEVKKLELFNYTYKKDPEKTPHVGVMAQDLEKIFPDAVFKGEDGFLRIRMEDMFYAMVNAIKELDNKLNLLEQKQKKIDELEARLDKLEKRLEKLEKLEKKAKKD